MSERIFTAACVQLQASQNVAANIDAAEALIREAAGTGADYVQTPEQTALMELRTEALFANIVAEEDDPALARLRALARELRIWLHIGSLAIKVAADKAANRAYVLSPEGEVAAAYDKIHMFDVDLPSGEVYRESKNYRAGATAVTADLPWARLGLSICYDLRFAYLYRALAHAGAEVLAIPAAFTRQTGEAHWHVLQRARAIETGCFVISAAQGGRHENGRETYGHSLIISPWGEILAEAGSEPCVIAARIDMAECAEARRRIPVLSHDRVIEVAGMPARPAGRAAE
ncbi:MAG: carbon-nitrogen hydrolase family protein [Rhodobiaceae bacterium]|nr:carbon-nitrogen hydrolase family protein [Rhodobiaceae bacterium]